MKTKTLTDKITKDLLFKMLINTNNQKLNIKKDKNYWNNYRIYKNIKRMNLEYIETLQNSSVINKKHIIKIFNEEGDLFDFDKFCIKIDIVKLNIILGDIFYIKLLNLCNKLKGE